MSLTVLSVPNFTASGSRVFDGVVGFALGVRCSNVSGLV